MWLLGMGYPLSLRHHGIASSRGPWVPVHARVSSTQSRLPWATECISMTLTDAFG